jgi:hypothetical protein
MTEEAGEIYAMDLNGDNIMALPKGENERIRQIHGVVGDHIYYWVITEYLEAGADKLVRMKVDGSSRKVVSAD